jgi:hypothetical protein
MSMKKILLAFMLGLISVGCAADSGWKVAYEQERSFRQEQEARIKSLEARQQPTQQAAQRQQPQQNQPVKSMDEVLTTCDQIEKNQNVAVSCKVKAVEDGQPTLAFGFRDKAVFDQYWSTIAQELGADYCVRAGQRNIDGYVSAFILDTRMGRIYSCSAQRYTTEWTYIPPQQHTPARNTY